ncbi:MAG: type II toxin-antitoxin system RelE/ParE family toxin [Chitinophagaceae bacterium]|nr:type II toxin-antitoxin system RelE/ParE family toxin [Chitinophagaceae bacterium]
MAIEVVWTHEAIQTFDRQIIYITSEWGELAAEKLFRSTDSAIQRIQLFPESYPPGVHRKTYRRARLNRHIVMFYKYHKAQRKISIITFWHSKQDPGKLKY